VAISVSGSDDDDDDASDDDAGVGDQHKVYLKKKARNKYSDLLSTIRPKQDDDDAQQDLEITFMPGLKDVGKRMLLEKSQKEKLKDETVWEKYQRERAEKKAAKRREARAASKLNGGGGGNDSDSDDGDAPKQSGKAGAKKTAAKSKSQSKSDSIFDDDDVAVDRNDPFFAEAFANGDYAGGGGDGNGGGATKKSGTSSKSKKSGKKSREEVDEENRQRAQLELLMDNSSADGNGGGKGFNLKQLVEWNKVKSGAKKAKHAKGELPVNDTFRVDTEDARFAPLFRDARFAIDTTDPRFKKTEGMQVWWVVGGGGCVVVFHQLWVGANVFVLANLFFVHSRRGTAIGYFPLIRDSIFVWWRVCVMCSSCLSIPIPRCCCKPRSSGGRLQPARRRPRCARASSSVARPAPVPVPVLVPVPAVPLLARARRTPPSRRRWRRRRHCRRPRRRRLRPTAAPHRPILTWPRS
jgi:hypothetical protein